jgi:oligoendopeptidase F
MRWDLKTLYEDCADAKKDLVKGLALVEKSSFSLLEETGLSLQEAAALYKQIQSYASCLLAIHPTDPSAQALLIESAALGAALETGLFRFGLACSKAPDQFKALLAKQPQIAYFLTERLSIAKQGLDAPREELIQALSIDGYHSYWNLYQLIASTLSLSFQGKELSMGQADNLLHMPDREVRAALFPIYEKTWGKQADLLAQVLNYLAGFRLQVYSKRGWKDPLFEPLRNNRMQRKTLDCMWAVIEESLPLFARYFAAKAKHLGLPKLSWYDLQAPILQSQQPLIPYEEAVETVLSSFGAWHPPLEAFCRHAIAKGWIESENRPGKQAGAFCYCFPKQQESRVFMTYAGTLGCVQTLAHELGHAYHTHCMKGLPYFATEYRMNVAETASTLGETLLIETLMKQCSNKQQKILLLDHKLQRASVFFTNLYARFLFESDFYKQRKEGFVDRQQLCTLMLEAQKKAFSNQLETYFPLFWAAKLHFYLTEEPFYNFPYTFGFILSGALRQSPEKVDAFLRESASCSSEELVQKHLGIDLQDRAFWRRATDSFAADLEEFVSL